LPPLPTETLTFLFTDIVGSTRLWDTQHDAMKRAHARQADLIAESVLAHNGHVVRSRGEGDSTFSVFASPFDALSAACAFQRALYAEAWPTDPPLRVRAALDLGPAEQREGDYNSSTVNRCARLRGLAAPGQTLVSEAVAEQTRAQLPDGVTLLALGTHRLKDLQRPVQIFQLCHAELPEEFAALRSLDTLPTNLPQQLTQFIGRKAELTHLTSLLYAPEEVASPRLLTLLGTGGAGKTRLAIQAGAGLLDSYPDGVWLVELAAIREEALVAQAAVMALGLSEEAGCTLIQTLQAYLRSRTLLLILDNCEHLVGACALLAETLLQTCPHLRLLATSREPLNIAGETHWRIPSLSLPGEMSLSSLEAVQGSEAAQLFTDRAQSASLGFQVTGQNAAAIAQICRQLDGIPLALELAAARVRALSVEQIAARLDDRFRLLTGGSRTALPRQQTLRALIDWSYDLLSEPERRLLARLSIFAGGWTLEAAEAVCAEEEKKELKQETRKPGSQEKTLLPTAGVLRHATGPSAWGCLLPSDVLDLLTSLVDKSLVLVEEREGGQRYRMLETVRQYGLEKLKASGEEPALRLRHLARCLEFAGEANRNLVGAEQAHWLEVVATEHDNLRQALTFCREAPGQAETGLRLAATMHRFWWMRGHLTEGRERYGGLLSHPEAQERTGARGMALNGAGLLAYFQGDSVSARARFEESLGIKRELGDRPGIANSLNNLGLVAHDQGDYTSALSLYAESLAIMRELGNKTGIANTLNNMGTIAQEQGDYASARARFEESLALRRELGDRSSIAYSLQNLGNVAKATGDYASALSRYTESMAILGELGDRAGFAGSLNNQGLVAYDRGDYATARTRFEESRAIQREVGNKLGVAHALGNLGNAIYAQGDYASARALHEESLEILREQGNRLGIAYALNSLGIVVQAQGDNALARSHYQESLAIRRELGNKQGIAESLEAFAHLTGAVGPLERAAALWGAAERLREELGSPLPPGERERYDRRVAEVRQDLGEEAFAAAWSEGRAMPPEQAIVLALQGAGAIPDGSSPHPKSARE